MRTRPYAPGFPGEYQTEPHPLELIALWLLGGLITLGALLWVTGQLSGRLFGGAWPHVGVAEMGRSSPALPHHLGDPADAWPVPSRLLIPGPVAFYGTFVAILAPVIAIVVLLMSRLRDRRIGHRAAHWARTHDLRLLRVRRPQPGRLILGRAKGRLVAAEPRQSVIVVGPTQTGKTTGFAVPAILEWQGPVVATSVKTDLLRETIAARSSINGAHTFVYDPTGSTGLPSAGWTPLMECLTWQGAQRVAEWLVRAARPGGSERRRRVLVRSDGQAARADPPRRRLQRRHDGTGRPLGGRPGRRARDPRARGKQRGGSAQRVRSDRTLGRQDPSVYATAQTVLIAYADPGVLASAMTAELRAERLLDGGWHTAYLCAPRTSSAAFSPCSRRSSRRSSPHAYERRDRNREAARPAAPPRPRRVRQHRAAARPRDARVDRRGTGHPARLRLPGHGADQRGLRTRPRPDDRLEPPREGDPVRHRGPADARLRRPAARRRGGRQVTSSTSGAEGRHSTTESVAYRNLAPANVLREMRPGHGVLVYGHLAPARIALRPWFKDRRLRQLARQPARRVEAALP